MSILFLAGFLKFKGVLESGFMAEGINFDPPERKKIGRPPKYDKKIMESLLGYIRAGLTWEKASEAVGIKEGTIRSWMERIPAFAEAVKKARRELEANLLNSVNESGAKSWQARAWMLERVFGYAQPSARLDIKSEVNHGLSPSLANMLAGIHSKPMTYAKPAQVVYGQQIYDNDYCATNKIKEKSEESLRLERLNKRKSIRDRKLRKTTTTPYPPPHAAAEKSLYPPEKIDQKQKEDGEAPKE